MRKVRNAERDAAREAAQQRAQEEAARALGDLSLGGINSDEPGQISTGNEEHIESFANKNFKAPKGQILSNDTRWIEVDKLDDNPYQPRSYMDAGELEELATGMQAVGQIHAILVRKHPTRKDRFQIAAGHRRKEAVRRGANAGAPGENRHSFVGKLRCEVRELNDFEMRIIAAQENIKRVDLPLLDQANMYRGLHDALGGPDSEIDGRRATWADVEKITGLSYRHMQRVMKITELPEGMKGKFADGTLNERHARALLSIDEESARDALFRAINREHLSGRQAENFAKELKENVTPGSHSEAQPGTVRQVLAPSGLASSGSGMDTGGGQTKGVSRETKSEAKGADEVQPQVLAGGMNIEAREMLESSLESIVAILERFDGHEDARKVEGIVSKYL